ncbi:SDR family NAD(P)-dependent oxidoreductase [Burkholderia multivorans]|uniref:SDR family NAD(P)-dependent oxidoreductase n=1 Tax=Burkholderia multivorans TaxID=87883 RepID=UPI000CFF9AA9|nr:SDR family NAD(P)-dependent oxidoreductase [Burkholderia multivorans]AYZ01389.1 SDR family NAD(P)-dependent oxidoreductase [Burkholderia multivorans]MBU9119980.1 SDR family NAD(P)-dependent oxidoreductase [Burkholderia multivorans]MBU9232775.1 SDR family NAD(P)-dependent oxidoreductase [Burkholderia multivorans]MBU9547625.1 SDR family NAD(P)-dependent oxidoreductase [Burkholderia multivorans]PRG50402.1 hypothetical protein C6T63_18340 [Burkholderia multivorans]
MKNLLQGKTAIVTGGSKGIGRATAELFISEGANVIISSLSEGSASRSPGIPIIGQLVPVSADTSWRDVVARRRE